MGDQVEDRPNGLWELGDRTIEQISAASPRSSEDAIDWQVQRLDSTAWEGWSWKFQRLAYGFIRDDRWVGPAEALGWFAEHGLLNGDPDSRLRHPRRGALVWHGPADDPVVRCSLGDGSVIGPGLPDCVQIAPIDRLDRPLGWTEPLFPFAR